MSTAVGVVLSLSAGALLCGPAVFVFYGYCEDACNKPPCAFWPAVGEALPLALVGLGLMAGACYLFMRGRRSTPPSFFKAAVLAILSSVTFIAGFSLLGVGGLGAFVQSDRAPRHEHVVGVIAVSCPPDTQPRRRAERAYDA